MVKKNGACSILFYYLSTDTKARDNNTIKGFQRKLMKPIIKIFSLIKNKYFLASVFFIVWMFFFDPKDWGMIHSRKNKLVMLEQNQENLNKLIGDCKIELGQLKSNAQTIEKYAREKYYMKKENEDLFIVNTEEKK